jgi:NAD(P)-dependent dehydrogenase (short-subunit alcohol dehydrogenase family)
MSAGKVAVITGGAGGLGQALAGALRAKGWSIAIIDLPGPELDAAGEAERTRCYRCDLTDESQIALACADICTDHPAIDLVIHNAGITQIGPFAELPLATHRKVFEVNYFGAVQVVSALLQAVRKARGVHVAISSVAGFAPLYRRCAYAASKHALEGFFKSLRTEEKAHGVDVLIAAPSFIATNIGRPDVRVGGIARPGSAEDGVDYMRADDAARIILAGIEHRRTMIPVGRIARAAWLINRLSPSLYARLMERRMSGKRQSGREPPKS